MMTWFDMKLKFYQWMQIKKKKTKNFVYQYKKQINDILYDHMISQDFSNSIQTLTLHYDLQVYLYNNWFTSANFYFRSIFRSFFFRLWNNSILVPTNLTTHDLTSITVSMHASTMTFSKNWPKKRNTFFPLVTITFIKTRIIKDIHMKPWWIFYTQVRNNICMDCNKKHLHGCCTYTVLYKNKMEDCCFLDLLIAFSSPHKQCYFSDVIKYTDFCCSYCLFAFYSLRVVFSNNF